MAKKKPPRDGLVKPDVSITSVDVDGADITVHGTLKNGAGLQVHVDVLNVDDEGPLADIADPDANGDWEIDFEVEDPDHDDKRQTITARTENQTGRVRYGHQDSYCPQYLHGRPHTNEEACLGEEEGNQEEAHEAQDLIRRCLALSNRGS